ncbi:hypothetical protein [Rhizobium lentis]|uniref:hypothetical protein n=1 Tax=Rhizobium lentis TaxID=1138194 RepID=UPI001C82B285|nr:hypothetical protein [Rhizobium lentis]
MIVAVEKLCFVITGIDLPVGVGAADDLARRTEQQAAALEDSSACRKSRTALAF